MNEVNRKYILEAALFASSEPLTLERLQQLFKEQDRPSPAEIKNLLSELSEDYEKRGVELCEVASGYRFQVKSNFAPWLQRLWEKKTTSIFTSFIRNSRFSCLPPTYFARRN